MEIIEAVGVAKTLTIGEPTRHRDGEAEFLGHLPRPLGVLRALVVPIGAAVDFDRVQAAGIPGQVRGLAAEGRLR
jgi:hypothetical protein